jgi:hypothetical protein
MSTLNVDIIRSSSFIDAPVDLNGTPVTKCAGTNSTGIGENSLQSSNNISTDNVALGKNTLIALTSGDDNAAFGNSALQLTTGNNNVGLGRNAGANNTTGSNNVFVGSSAEGSSATVSNEITLGNSSHTVIRAAVTSITSLSDARDKKDISELPVGLDFVKELKPVTFTWNDRYEGGKHDVKDFGFIAQDLKKAQENAKLAETLKLVYEENPDKLEASYGKLIPILVKAIQELTAKVEALENK